MARALRVCSCIGCTSHPGSCPKLVKAGRCSGCVTVADRARGSRQQRGYDERHAAFRRSVLLRDPTCVRCGAASSQHADHHPISLRDLRERGLNPYDPERGRGLCHPCHSAETARNQPGGFNAR